MDSNSNSRDFLQQDFNVLLDMKCEKHPEENVTQVVISKNQYITLRQCFQCKKCSVQSNSMITIQDFLSGCNKKKVGNSNERLYIPLNIYCKQLQKFKVLVDNLKIQVQAKIQQIQNSLYQQYLDIHQKIAFQELQLKINEQHFSEASEEKLMKDIKEDIYNFQKKIFIGLKSFNEFEQYQKFEQQFENLDEEMNQVVKKKEINFNLINDSILQEEDCYSICFNHNNKLMISGCQNHVRMWEFDAGKISQIHNIKAHSNPISCLLFSKFENNFISGSSDGSLKCWILNNKQLTFSDIYEYHPKGISCMILNQSENLLFTGDMDKNILIWETKLSEQKLNLLTSLASHQNRVFGLSLNESETILVSCSLDQQIIIWKKLSNSNWQFERNINQYYQEFANRIKFISNNRFIWVSGSRDSQDCLIDIQLDNKNGLQRQSKISFLKYQDAPDGIYFPIFYLKLKEYNLIVAKHKLTIYLIKETNRGDLQIVQLCKQKSTQFYGAVTSDGKYMVIWEWTQKFYRIYEIEF